MVRDVVDPGADAAGRARWPEHPLVLVAGVSSATRMRLATQEQDGPDVRVDEGDRSSRTRGAAGRMSAASQVGDRVDVVGTASSGFATCGTLDRVHLRARTRRRSCSCCRPAGVRERGQLAITA